MAQSIVVKSFAELANLFPEDDAPSTVKAKDIDKSSSLVSRPDDHFDLTRLVEELEAAGVTLAKMIVKDQEERAIALRDLERYDALVQQQREADIARERASRILQEAEAFIARAFGEEAQTEAARIAEAAGKAEELASRRAEAWREEAERLAMELDLERLLLERQLQEEAEKAKAAAAEKAERLSGALVRAKSALEAGRFQEARELLGSVTSENPDNPEIASLTKIIIQRELAVKVSTAEEALWIARREFRHDPAGVIARLEALNIAGLPASLARQVFGEWARACSRLCRDRGLVAPLRYAPNPGRGAVLARESAETAYVVVSSLGMGPSWRSGEAVDDGRIRRARPLR